MSGSSDLGSAAATNPAPRPGASVAALGQCSVRLDAGWLPVDVVPPIHIGWIGTRTAPAVAPLRPAILQPGLAAQGLDGRLGVRSFAELDTLTRSR